ncbi:MAG: hypothetical protein ACYTEZ_20480 [Planctomycetota bacterium]
MAVACLALGAAVGYVVGRGDRDTPAPRNARVPATAAILEEIERLRQEVRAGRGTVPPAQGRDANPVQDRATPNAASRALQEAGVVLDPRDVESAVRVLETYTYRRERRWWKHNLERFIGAVRAREEKLKPSRKAWLARLDEALADLRAVADADGLDAWVNRYRRTFEILPSELVVINSLWGDWLRFCGVLR